MNGLHEFAEADGCFRRAVFGGFAKGPMWDIDCNDQVGSNVGVVRMGKAD